MRGDHISTRRPGERRDDYVGFLPQGFHTPAGCLVATLSRRIALNLTITGDRIAAIEAVANPERLRR